MELRAIWKIIRRRWWLIVLPTAAALVVTGFKFWVDRHDQQPAYYTTSVRFTAAVPPGEEVTSYEADHYYPWLASEYLIVGLGDWMRSGSFSQEIAERAAEQGVEVAATIIQANIAVESAHTLLRLTMSWHDADALLVLVNSAIAVLEESSADYFPQIGDGTVVISALDATGIVEVPPPVEDRLMPILQVGLGVAAGFALAFLVEYLDPTVCESQEIEEMGVPVLAEIPRRKRY
nr:hypothetical protein [Anaerolineae bacterium]